MRFEPAPTTANVTECRVAFGKTHDVRCMNILPIAPPIMKTGCTVKNTTLHFPMPVMPESREVELPKD